MSPIINSIKTYLKDNNHPISDKIILLFITHISKLDLRDYVEKDTIFSYKRILNKLIKDGVLTE